MADVVETKGFFKLKGKANLEKVKAKDLGWMQTATLPIRTLEDNFVHLTIEAKNGKGPSVKIKKAGAAESVEHSIGEALGAIKEAFTKEDMLMVFGVAGYNTRLKRFVLKPTGVYYSDSEYNDSDFEEVNFVTYELIFDSMNDGRAKMLHVSYFGEITEIELTVSDGLIEEFKSFRYGDLVKLVFSIVNKPIYSDANAGSKYIPKGRGVERKPTVEGFLSDLVVVGIVDVKPSLYTRTDIRDAKEDYERKQEEYQVTKARAGVEGDNDDELPY